MVSAQCSRTSVVRSGRGWPCPAPGATTPTAGAAAVIARDSDPCASTCSVNSRPVDWSSGSPALTLSQPHRSAGPDGSRGRESCPWSVMAQHPCGAFPIASTAPTMSAIPRRVLQQHRGRANASASVTIHRNMDGPAAISARVYLLPTPLFQVADAASGWRCRSKAYARTPSVLRPACAGPGQVRVRSVHPPMQAPRLPKHLKFQPGFSGLDLMTARSSGFMCPRGPGARSGPGRDGERPCGSGRS